MKRAIIIGCSGAGKSTFARKLAEISHLPLYYLDMYWHKPDKTTVTREEFAEKLNVLLQKDEWILDGNFARTLEMRLQACDTVFLMDYPLEVCLNGVRGRIGTKREDMPWVEEEFDPDFQEWIEGFSQNVLPKMLALIEKYKAEKEVYIFKSRAEADAYLTKLKQATALR